MKYKNIIFVLISIFILTSNAEASNKKFKILFTIPPTVERALASETKNYISRELRSLHDVEQVDKDSGSTYYFLSIFPVSLKLTNGQQTGIAISYVIEKDESIEHIVLVGGPDELKSLCEKIVAHLDTYWLKSQRKSH